LPPPAPAVPIVPSHGSVKALFAPGMLSRTLIGSIVLIVMNTAVYGFIAFMPTFMVKQGMNIVTSLNYTTLMMFGGPVGALIGLLLADRIGRKACIVWFSVLSVVVGAIYPQTTDPMLVTLAGFLLVTAVYVLVAITFALYVPELFPTDIRMRGAGFCNTAGRMMTILTPQIIVPLFATGGVNAVIGMVSGLLILQAVVVGFFGIETRRKPLEALGPQGDADVVGVARAAAGD
jgi:putative MFS transporter